MLRSAASGNARRSAGFLLSQSNPLRWASIGFPFSCAGEAGPGSGVPGARRVSEKRIPPGAPEQHENSDRIAMLFFFARNSLISTASGVSAPMKAAAAELFPQRLFRVFGTFRFALPGPIVLIEGYRSNYVLTSCCGCGHVLAFHGSRGYNDINTKKPDKRLQLWAGRSPIKTAP